MKKFVCILLCIIICGCFVLFLKVPKKNTLDQNNILDYVSIEINFGDVNIFDNDSSQNYKYYLTCLATITVKPKGNYDFTDASVTCALGKETLLYSNPWNPKRTYLEDNNIIYLKDWEKKIQLDKDGYGETTVFLTCHSNSYDDMHPYAAYWRLSASDAAGTVAKPLIGWVGR